MYKAAFFDRDGTLIRDVNYLSDLNQVEILPAIIPFCLDLQKKGYLLFVVTNQSGVARGFFDELFVQQTHLHLDSIFKKQGVNFQKFYYCPHHPTEATNLKYKKDCECRKPKPGLILKAAEEFNLDLSQSLMFGDKELDIQAGKSAGCKSFFIQDSLF
ncbi:MAG: HAD family hydrolase [Bacteroidota bacterium]